MTTGVSWKQATAQGCTSQWAEQHKLKPKRVKTGIRGKAAGFLRSKVSLSQQGAAPRYPADLHSVGRLLHLLPQSVSFGARGLQVAGQTRGLGRLLPPAERRQSCHGGMGTCAEQCLEPRATTLPRAEPMEMVPTQDGVQHPLPTSASPLPATGCTHPALIKQFISAE